MPFLRGARYCKAHQRCTLLQLLALAPRAVGDYETAFPGVGEIWRSACSQEHPPAGFDGGGYELMYGIFLLPLRALGSRMRLLEIGLGCDMSYGPGASAILKRNLLPEAQMWEAELDGACVAKYKPALSRLRITPLVGDQGNQTTLGRWIEQIGGVLNVVIDDGAHTNAAILASFRALWPRLAPGGLYFFEDLNVGRMARWDSTHGDYVISDILQAWQEQLIVFRGWGGRGASNAATQRSIEIRRKHPLPCGVKFLYCQDAACVLGKETVRNRNRHNYRSGIRCAHDPSKSGSRAPGRDCPSYYTPAPRADDATSTILASATTNIRPTGMQGGGAAALRAAALRGRRSFRGHDGSGNPHLVDARRDFLARAG